ncbi:MAG: heme-binding beta-barrel domain-containing protein, partial [bacterium]|nr:heme-binding beta-barrel domain-containing protein [bacterium]
ETNAYVETFDLQPIDPQTNGPQRFYGLRYHQHIVKTGEIEMFHEQVGFLLWEPASSTVIMTLAIPRGQVAMAGGTVGVNDAVFTLRATAGDPNFGISTNPFLDEAFHTSSWEITFRIGTDGTWAYEQVTMLDVLGQDEPFAHRDTSILTRTGPARPNPLASKAMARLTRLHHVQLAIPPGGEDACRAFWGSVLGMAELEKPHALAARGGCWFRGGGLEVHLGVEPQFTPALKAHPGIEVVGLDQWATRLRDAGIATEADHLFPGFDRFYAVDPFGNRLEFMERRSS